MVISFQPQGRLGNQLFSFAFAYLLAKELDVRLLALPLPEFPSTNGAIESTASRDWRLRDIEAVTDTGETFDSIEHRCKNKLVQCHGWFQRSEFYWLHREELKRVFTAPKTTHKTGIVFHFRGGDFVGGKKDTPLEFYMSAWEQLGKPKHFTVRTDDERCAVMNSFLQRTDGYDNWGRSFDPLADFNLMANASTLVISQSTFAWWAAFLSSARVIQPQPVETWSCRNLTVPEWGQIQI